MEVIGETLKGYTNIPYGLASPLSSESAQNMGFRANESMHANEHYYQGGLEYMEEYLAEAQAKIDKYGHSIYRYWPQMWEEQD